MRSDCRLGFRASQSPQSLTLPSFRLLAPCHHSLRRRLPSQSDRVYSRQLTLPAHLKLHTSALLLSAYSLLTLSGGKALQLSSISFDIVQTVVSRRIPFPLPRLPIRSVVAGDSVIPFNSRIFK